jgi:hypothetical protein
MLTGMGAKQTRLFTDPLSGTLNGLGLPVVALVSLGILEEPAPPCHYHLMRQVLNDIEAGKLADELKRQGIKPSQRLCVIIESFESDDPPITAVNASSRAFDWLAEEPDLYGDADLAERYRV